MPKKIMKWLKSVFVGKKKLTKHDILKERLRICASAGIKPWDVSNFWEGIEELKGKVCMSCGKKFSKKSQRIAKILGAKYGYCKQCTLKLKPEFSPSFPFRLP